MHDLKMAVNIKRKNHGEQRDIASHIETEILWLMLMREAQREAIARNRPVPLVSGMEVWE